MCQIEHHRSIRCIASKRSLSQLAVVAIKLNQIKRLRFDAMHLIDL